MRIKQLIQTCSDIITKPQQSWTQIQEHAKSLRFIYFNYLLSLLLSLPIASVLGNYIFNPLFRKPIGIILLSAFIKIFVLFITILSVSILAVRLAKLYQGKASKANIHRLIVYSSTAYIVACVLAAMFENYHSFIIVCQLMGIYSIYVMNVGLPKMIEMPVDKRIPFVASVVLLAIILNVGIRFLLTNLFQITSI